jgi:hypothetical protein
MMLVNARRERVIVRLAEWIQAKGLGAPAILFLQAYKPLAPVLSHILLFSQPLFGSVGPMLGWFDDEQSIAEYALLLEDPTIIDQILLCLERCPTGRG